MRRFLSLFTMLMLCGVLAFAQSRVVTGKVSDADGNGIPFATVAEVGPKPSTVVADANGNFSIRTSGKELIYSATGYSPSTVSISGDRATAILIRDNKELATVVVTTLGQTVRTKELGTSIATVKAAELTQAKVINLQNGLTGKVSGLNVQTVNNGVFGDTRITLRGIRSLTGNNQPMLVLDGVPIALSFLSSINPNDIKDVTILKSSSSTAIYGPDGVNGAIIVTTTRGLRSKPSVSISQTTQFETVTFMPKFQNSFGSGSSVDQFGYGVYDGIENQGYGDKFDGSLRQIGRDGPGGVQNLITYEARPNEKRKFWDVGRTNQTDVSLSAGDFYVSGQNVDIKGIVPKDKNHRISFNMSAAKEFSKLRASFNVRYVQSNYNINAGSEFGNGRDFTPYWNLINTPAQINVTAYKNWQTDYFSSPDGYYNDYYSNPYWAVDNFRNVGRSNDVLGNIELNYKLTPSINVTYRLGATSTNSSSKSTQGALTYSAFAKASGKAIASSGDLAAGLIDRSFYSTRINSEIFVTAKKQIKKFKFELLLGQSYRETKSKNLTISSTNLGIPSVFNISTRKGEATVGEGTTQTKLERFFGRLSVGFGGWAFAEFTGSNDIDSRLANPYKYNAKDISFFYPGANLSLVLSEAIPAIKKSNTISLIKVRGAISKTGNVNLDAYSLQNTFTPGTDFPFGSLLGFSADNTLRRDKYVPEFVKNTEVGLELGFLKNRISIEATAYKQDNSNQVITVAYSAATGYPSALLNAASFVNKGLEFDLKLTPLVKIRDVSIDVKGNYSYQKNKVYSLVDGVDELGIGNGNFIIKGQSAYTFRLTDYVRDDQGRVIVSATTGLPTQSATTSVFGQTLPKHIVGLSFAVNWKNLTLSSVFDYRTGNQIYSGIGGDLDFSGLSYRTGQNNRQPFIFPNSVISNGTGGYTPNTNVYTQTGGYNFWSTAINTGVNSNYISDGSFIKMRELALSFNFPEELFKGKGLKGASIALTGRNLFTWLPKTNEWTDPEFSNTTGNAQGVNDRNNTPPTRIVGANITLNF